MSIGFPDFQRGAAAASPVLINTSGPVDTFVTLPAFAVSSWPYVSFILDTVNSTAFYYVEFRWNNSLTPNDFKASDIVVFGPGAISCVQLVARSPFCQIHIVNINLIAAQTISVFGYGTVGLERHATVTQNAVPLIFINTSVAAAASASFDAQPTVIGEATVYMSTTVTTTWDVHLSYYDLATAAFKTFWQYAHTGATPDGSINFTIKLPPSRIRMVIHNSGAGAATFIGGLNVI